MTLTLLLILAAQAAGGPVITARSTQSATALASCIVTEQARRGTSGSTIVGGGMRIDWSERGGAPTAPDVKGAIEVLDAGSHRTIRMLNPGGRAEDALRRDWARIGGACFGTEIGSRAPGQAQPRERR